jgi:Neuraminidase (sialidase)
MAEKKVYFDSGFTNVVKKTSDKSPDVRINMTLSTETLNAIIAAGGKMQLSGWNANYGKGDTVSWKASADTFVPKTTSGPIASDELESDIPF